MGRVAAAPCVLLLRRTTEAGCGAWGRSRPAPEEGCGVLLNVEIDMNIFVHEIEELAQGEKEVGKSA
ncbi:hypothetical protein RIF29_29424 [Crotalaria pallida]|uniref:Uncharacterized protein n=1 Tax=Crotalaria pallida TaxID=3830 RepID=A0AAN9EGQ0_CROPI